MRKVFKVFLLSVVALMMLAGSAMAYTVTYQDTTVNWPGYWDGISNPAYYPGKLGDYREYIGSPVVSSMAVTINDTTNNLEKVEINMVNRLVFDSLFIQKDVTSGESYENWDLYVYDDNLGSGGAKMFDITPGYVYTKLALPFERIGHPTGIYTGPLAPGVAENTTLLYSLEWDGAILTYKFNPGILLGDYKIGYTPWCANDVVLTPEPTTLLLLGMGLLGVAVIRRKK